MPLCVIVHASIGYTEDENRFPIVRLVAFRPFCRVFASDFVTSHCFSFSKGITPASKWAMSVVLSVSDFFVARNVDGCML